MSADKILQERRKLFIEAVTEGTINGLLDELFQNRVLNKEEVDIITHGKPTDIAKARSLIDSVVLKGAQACQIFISSVCEADPFLAKKIGLSSGPQTRNDANAQDSPLAAPFLQAYQSLQVQAAELPSSQPEGILKLCSPETARRIQNENSAEIYPIREKLGRTRCALIICNTDFDHLSRRTGADVDLRGMRTLLQRLGYTVYEKENLTASEMTAELKRFADLQDHETSDSTFVVLMSHGIKDGICGKKYSKEIPDVLQVNTIFQSLNTLHCPKLEGKPKVIIIQACRGENQGVVWVKDSVSESSSSPAPDDYEDDAVKKAHVEKDFIAFCSSTPDNVSWRHPTLGSLFIMRLIENFQKYAWSFDLEAIFRKVQYSFEKPDDKAQMPTVERKTLTRNFYLFPGC